MAFIEYSCIGFIIKLLFNPYIKVDIAENETFFFIYASFSSIGVFKNECKGGLK